MKYWDIRKVFSDAKTLVKFEHCKFVFVKAESSATRNIWKRSFIDNTTVSVLLAHSWFNSYAPELVPIFYYHDKTQVQMFYFLIKKPECDEDPDFCFVKGNKANKRKSSRWPDKTVKIVGGTNFYQQIAWGLLYTAPYFTMRVYKKKKWMR